MNKPYKNGIYIISAIILFCLLSKFSYQLVFRPLPLLLLSSRARLQHLNRLSLLGWVSESNAEVYYHDSIKGLVVESINITTKSKCSFYEISGLEREHSIANGKAQEFYYNQVNPPTFLRRFKLSSVASLLPDGAKIDNCTTYAAKNRAVWSVSYLETNGLRQWLHKFLPAVPMQSQQMTSLWVTQMDGSHPRLLGVAPESYAGIFNQKCVNFISWQPSGKGIGFVYGDALYVVAVE